MSEKQVRRKKNGEDNIDLFAEIQAVSEENNISVDILIENIKQGLIKAVKREHPDCENIMVELNPETESFRVALVKTIVEGEPESENEVNIDVARAINRKAIVGGICEVPISTKKLGRVTAGTAKQSIRHDIKEFEKNKLIEQYKGKEHEAVSATVLKVEPSGNATLKIDNNEVYLFKNEQIPGESLRAGDIVKVYVVGIINPDRKPAIKISRTHKELVKRLFELEIPEIYDGTVEIKSISREAGSRTKIAVWSKDENVDAVGACIGSNKKRIIKVVEELNGEKIDIIPYSEKPEEFIANALAPSAVTSVTIADSEQKVCSVIVPDNQLSLAIGNRGQNAKLAAKLTGYKIDIKPESDSTAQ